MSPGILSFVYCFFFHSVLEWKKKHVIVEWLDFLNKQELTHVMHLNHSRLGSAFIMVNNNALIAGFL